MRITSDEQEVRGRLCSRERKKKRKMEKERMTSQKERKKHGI
jgi:hypothetical protein